MVLRLCYTAVRAVKLNNDMIDVTCTIDGDNSGPIFKCSTSTDSVINCSARKIS